MNPETLQKLKNELVEEKKRLEDELSSFAVKDPHMRDNWDAKFPATAASAPPFSHSSQEEQADIREEYEAELAQEQSLEGRLREVRRALERMAEGAYGRCKTCGDPIPEERLAANPAAEYDIKHQSRE